ncbi:MAG: helix-turn-helix domain-containing protein [Bacteroidota bacterium]
MKDFGTYLQQARETADLTLEDLHQRTRISLKNLRLIESGDFPSIPQTYVRAFVREYARTVGLDEDAIIAAYNDAAELEKGIPRPPEPIDSSNLLPKVDDSVEFVLPSDQPPSHVEVDGTAEVEAVEFIPPVRKSSYVREGDAAAIDIRTSTHSEYEAPAPISQKNPTPPVSVSTPKEMPVRLDSAIPPEEASASEATPPGKIDLPAATASVPAAAPSKATTPSRETELASAAAAAAANDFPEKPPVVSQKEPAVKPPVEPQKDAAIKPAVVPQKDAAAKPAVVSHKDAPPKAAETKVKSTPARESAAQNKDTARATAAAVPPPAPVSPPVDGGNERRIIGVGLVIIAFISISIYGIFFFSSDSSSDAAAIDSTSIKASIEAGRFIDSSQYAMTDLNLTPEDTASGIPITPPEPVEAQKRVFAKEDSLVLEAFTSAPVWFSVKMDTLRTERGSLSSNEHRVWKARDYFMITLGDAGAVTFFLNGKEIGTLGEEGAVVKNFTLSRQQLNGN